MVYLHDSQLVPVVCSLQEQVWWSVFVALISQVALLRQGLLRQAISEKNVKMSAKVYFYVSSEHIETGSITRHYHIMHNKIQL